MMKHRVAVKAIFLGNLNLPTLKLPAASIGNSSVRPLMTVSIMANYKEDNSVSEYTRQYRE